MVLKSIHPLSRSAKLVEQLHIFDLDRTLVKTNSSMLLCQYLLSKGLISYSVWLKCIIRYLCYSFGLSEMRQQIVRAFELFFKDKPAQSILVQLDAFWNEVLANQFRKCLLQRLEQIRSQGHVIALFSASPNFLVEYIAVKMGFHYVLASEYHLDSHGLMFLSVGQIADGPTKAQSVHELRQKFPSALIHGYSDSWDDVDFLKSVDSPWLVAADKKLTAWARQIPSSRIWSLDPS